MTQPYSLISITSLQDYSNINYVETNIYFDNDIVHGLLLSSDNIWNMKIVCENIRSKIKPIPLTRSTRIDKYNYYDSNGRILHKIYKFDNYKIVSQIIESPYKKIYSTRDSFLENPNDPLDFLTQKIDLIGNNIPKCESPKFIQQMDVQ